MIARSAPRPWGPSARAMTIVALVATALSLAGRAGAMPVPARGNTRGLPATVRAALRANPDLFYPKKGFRPVIERMKVQRAEIVRQQLRSGASPLRAQQVAAQSVATVRYCPVLCGIYADKPTPDYPAGDLNDELFRIDYSANNPFGDTGSMREYYRDVSFGTFDLQGGVFGWFPVPQAGAYYYGTDNGLGTDAASGEAGAFLEHTLQTADATVDFRPYDNDGPDGVPNSGDDDGVVDLVMFVHPNEGGECGGDDIWSHSFSYSGWTQHNGQMYVTNDLGANGQPLKVDDYTIMPALACGGARRIEVGVFAHEFGHALGLPDLYDRTAVDPQGLVTSGGMGLFCIMAAGSYGGDYDHPATPTQMCAWSKENLGFIQPHEVVCDETRAVYCADDSPEAVKLWRGGDYSQHEWFLVENRQRVKWDTYLLGTGFLVTHADDKVLTQNDEPCPGGNPCPNGHYQVMVIEADGQFEMEGPAAPLVGPWFGEAEDFFSASGNDSLTDLTVPSSRDHAGVQTGIQVTGISASARKMTARFSVGQACTGAPDLAIATTRVTGGCDLDPFVDAGEDASLAVTIRNMITAAPATNVSATLTSLSPLVTVTGGTARFPDVGRGSVGTTIVPFRVHGDASAACSTSATLRLDLVADGGYAVQRTFTVRVGLDSLYVPTALFADDIESGGANGWTHYAMVNEDDWAQSTNGNHTALATPGHSWFSAAPATGKDVSLEPPGFTPSATSVVSYWHRYDTEDDWDGYVLELSTDGGASWIDVGDQTNIGYDDAVMVNPQSTISGRRCWNGLNAGFPQFEQVTLPLATWAGQHCLLRFRMATDLATTGTTPLTGLNIDDFQLTDAGVLQERCEAAPACGGTETDPPVFAGLEEAFVPGSPACDAVELKWHAATDASGPVTYLVYGSADPVAPLDTPIASTANLHWRVTGLAQGATWRFRVRARDSQGNVDANTVDRTVTLDCTPPDLVVESVALTEVAGCDGDGRPDAGETLELRVTLRNAGFTTARNVRASLGSVPPYVYVRQHDDTYPTMETGHVEAGTTPFRFSVHESTPCLTNVVVPLVLQAEGGYQVTRSVPLVLESDGPATCDVTAACAIVAVADARTTFTTRIASIAPNPARALAKIEYEVAAGDAGDVSLRVYDLAGRQVKALVDGRATAGRHVATWDRTNDRGERVAGGVYFSQLRVGGRVMERKVVLMK